MSEQTHRGMAALWIIIIIVLVLGILSFGLWWYWQFYMAPTSTTPNIMTATPPGGSKIDSALVGTWESECLIPAPTNSKWAEKHQFIINADGTAQHTRWSWGAIDCTTLQPEGTIVSKFKLAIPSSGKINLSYTEYNNPGLKNYAESGLTTGNPTLDKYLEDAAKADPKSANATIYDIYKTTATTLEFGHGFRNTLSYGAKSGGSESDRFDTLNNYIVYKKK